MGTNFRLGSKWIVSFFRPILKDVEVQKTPCLFFLLLKGIKQYEYMLNICFEVTIYSPICGIFIIKTLYLYSSLFEWLIRNLVMPFQVAHHNIMCYLKCAYCVYWKRSCYFKLLVCLLYSTSGKYFVPNVLAFQLSGPKLLVVLVFLNL
jgi:hypothetical protein